MASFDEKALGLLTEFERFTREQQSELLKRLLLKCQPLQLRVLYAELKPLLAIDFASNLPKEVTHRILSYLPAKELCRVTRCNSLWRDRANHNPIWHKLCQLRGWEKFGENQPLSLDNSTVYTIDRPTSPSCKTPPPAFSTGMLQPPTCRWKTIYIRAYYLQKNWETGNYTIAPILRGHREPINDIACNGRVLVSAGSDNCARVWDIKEARCTHVLDTPHTDSVRCVQLVPPKCVTGCADGVVRIFNVNTGACIRNVCIWNANSGKLLQTLRGHTDEIEFLVMRKSYVISTSWDESIRLWDTTSGTCSLTLRGHSEVAYCCQFDDEKVVTGGGDNLIMVWSAHTGECTATLSGHTGEVYCLAFNDEIIASGSADSSVRIWSFRGVCLFTLEEHIGVVRCLHLSGDRLVSGGDRKKIAVWNTKSGKLLNVVHRNPTLLHKLWADETKLITASPEKPGTITIINYW
ncbi:predicted protein [Nematostella vectensis]|uniref:F-box domain-containing protein n=1 Tax=Nematostella vectensis TaxID=45351 RepID=A7STE1_NEMVE|nr:predicted protein [Nematostella vectensis]|eukprot:XP_001625132.1 predicted protein [Nematostella vectensis]